MRHRCATDYLPDLGSGSLDAATEVALSSHVDGCTACQEWLATREVLAGGLSETPNSHPDSDVLALCVMRPEEVHEPGREDLRIHLESCLRCRREVALVRAAVHAARPARREVSETSRSPSFKVARRWMAAAVAVLVVGGGALLLGPPLLDRWAPETSRRADTARGTSLPVSEEEEREELSGLDLEGVQVIGRDRTLVVSQVTVTSGADVTFRSDRGVVFGDGFRVAKGGRLRVGSSPVTDLSNPESRR